MGEKYDGGCIYAFLDWVFCVSEPGFHRVEEVSNSRLNSGDDFELSNQQWLIQPLLFHHIPVSSYIPNKNFFHS